MNVLTTGIILYSFYMSICMDTDEEDDDVFGDPGGSMLPPRQRSSVFSGGLGSTFTSGYSDQEFDEKFKHMRIGKKPKDKLGRTNQPQQGAPGAYPPPAAAGPYGGGYPSQQGAPGAYPPPAAAGPYGGGYPSQQGAPGAYPPPAAAGPYGGGYPTQQGAPGAYPPPAAAGPYGGGYPSQQGAPGAYPPPAAAGAQGPAYPPGYGQPVASGGYGGGASGGAGGYGGGYPSQPGGPQGAAGHPGQPIMMKIDAKNRRNPNTKLDRFTLSNGGTQHVFRPDPGHGIKQVNYDGDRVWSMDRDNFGTEVLVDPIGSGAKTMTIKMVNGDEVTFTKSGRNKPWTKQ
uniref:CD8+ T-cell target antigen Tp9 n=1 Tax=Theileria parva lawrencei TaxID=1148490 RepID=H9A5K6_THEPA|nr:CD8+ T-cell target antigen Tp9 [Theileria parva lawrencei]